MGGTIWGQILWKKHRPYCNPVTKSWPAIQLQSRWLLCVCTCIYICLCVSVGRAAGARLGGRGKHTDPFSINGCHLLNILLFISLEKMTLKLCPSKIYQTWTGNRVYSHEVRGELLLWHWPPPPPNSLPVLSQVFLSERTRNKGNLVVVGLGSQEGPSGDDLPASWGRLAFLLAPTELLWL